MITLSIKFIPVSTTYNVVQKAPYCFLNNLAKSQPILIIFGSGIRRKFHTYTSLSTSPVKYSHCTFKN